jgi:two-component system LytT family response regulator
MIYTVQIVEDNENCVFVIRNYLESFENIKIIGVTNSVLDTYNCYLECKPDILLLDVELGEEYVFKFLDLIKPKSELIFITGYPEYAIKAIKNGAKDYLLKPILEDEFKLAINNAIENIKAKPNDLNNLLDNKFIIENGSADHYSTFKSIVYLKAISNYTEFNFTDSKSIVTSKTLKIYEKQLPSSLFVRINHGILINLYHLKKLNRDNSFSVILTGDINLPISFRKKSVFFELISNSRFFK